MKNEIEIKNKVMEYKAGKRVQRCTIVLLLAGKGVELHVGGKTYAIKDELKNLGFRWNGMSWQKYYAKRNYASVIEMFKAIVEDAQKVEKIIMGVQ